MEKKIDVAKKFLQDHEALFRCPKCHSAMNLKDNQLVCENHHSFQLSKKGTLYFLEKQIKTEYTKDMFTHRKEMIQKGLYTTVMEALKNWLEKEDTILDVGCGEGSFLSLLGQKVTGPKLGFDISKDGIALASELRLDNSFFHVADLTNLPYENHVFDKVLNIFSPSNYQEFRRVLKPKGYLLKVIPGSDYLKELRQALYEGDKKSYSNEEVLTKLRQEVTVEEEISCHYEVPLTDFTFSDLVKMTPLSWGATPEKLAELYQKPFQKITIHVILTKCRL